VSNPQRPLANKNTDLENVPQHLRHQT